MCSSMSFYPRADAGNTQVTVPTEKGPNVDPAVFEEWYDHNHMPRILALPGFLGSSRFLAIDNKIPSQIALYANSLLFNENHH
jgi:hypothetical protein